MMGKIITISLVYSCFLLNIYCVDKKLHNDRNSDGMDTLIRPAYVPKSATLTRFGSSQEPRYVWVEYMAPYTENNKKYNHIPGFRFIYSKTSIDTIYYEAYKIRNSDKEFNLNNFKIEFEQIDEGGIYLSRRGDSLDLFSVLGGGAKLNKQLNVVQYSRVSTVKKIGKTFMGSDFLKCNLEKTGKARYVLRLLDGTEVLYKLSGSCTDEPQTVSFIDIDSGNILFVQKHCFLELVDKNELYKLKAGI